jgi:hypothetical protein
VNRLHSDRDILASLGSVTIPEFAFFLECSEQTSSNRLRALLEAGHAHRHPDDGKRRSARGKRPWVYTAVKA